MNLDTDSETQSQYGRKRTPKGDGGGEAPPDTRNCVSARRPGGRQDVQNVGLNRSRANTGLAR